VSLADKVARGLRLPFPLLALKLSQRGRALTNRLVTDSASAWRPNGVSAVLLAAIRADLGRRFFVNPADRAAVVATLNARHPDAVAAVVRAADDVCAHRFDLLGSGPTLLGEPIDWHRDFKSGIGWDMEHHAGIDVLDLDRPSDVKVVWELSRCHHWVTLGQAYWLTDDDRYAAEFVAQWESWMVTNPLRFGVNWTCAMEVAIRAINWLWAFSLFGDAARFDQDRQVRFVAALADHGRFILHNLEVGLLPGNHYLTNGIGLLTLGVVLRDFAEARRWFSRGWRILWGEVERQITTDGVDYEHAIGYHSYVLHCLLFAVALCQRNGIDVPAAGLARIGRMLDFTLAYTRPDGSFPAIGDSDDGGLVDLGCRPAQNPRSLLGAGAALFGRADLKAAAGNFGADNLWWLGRAGLQAYEAIPEKREPGDSQAFPLGGFFVMRGENRHMVISGSGTGPASHLHHDMLSFECWADGIAYVVDPGTYTYTASRESRNRFRSTGAHNTVMVDGHEQTRLLDDPNIFPVERDETALFSLHRWQTSEDLDWFDGQHTGYTRLPEPVVHRRQVWFDKRRGVWAVRDLLTGMGHHAVTGALHLAPLPARIESRDPWVLRVGEGSTALLVAWTPDHALSVSIRDGWVSPHYGIVRPAPVITYAKQGRLPMEIRFVLAPTTRGACPDLDDILRWAGGLA
jgi:hypothetical protein